VKILIDTNTYSAFKRNRSDVVQVYQRAEEIHISVTVLAELIAGFKAGSKENQNREELRSFLSSERAILDPMNEGTAEFYAHIYLLLRFKGSPIPTNDMWIAAAAMQNGCALYSLDTHFGAVDGLLLV
jgi:tRNA(fMet)-specific endonuclease VapC